MLVAIAIVLAGILVAGAVYASQGLRRLEKRSVVVHTTDDRSLKGILAAVHRDCLVIAHPIYLDEANPAELPGEAVIPRANVSWLQNPEA